MAKTEPYIPKAEFNAIYGRVPRLTVEVIIRTPKGVILTKRSIDPCKGQWHIPGGTVRFGEPLFQAVKRVALGELGVVVAPGKLLGYIEYPQMMANGYKGWPVGMAFAAEIIAGEVRGSEQGEEIGYFLQVPANTISEQEQFLSQHVISGSPRLG